MSNCLLYALLKWYREGGSIRRRPSRHGWWWHFMHQHKGGEVTHYVPLCPKRRLFPPPLFKGAVVIGDE
jgi:hypothetical protein